MDTNRSAYVVLALILLSTVGCGSQVKMTAPYAEALESSAIACGELNQRCQGGDDEACKLGLDACSETLDLLVDGLYGRVSEPNSGGY